MQNINKSLVLSTVLILVSLLMAAMLMFKPPLAVFATPENDCTTTGGTWGIIGIDGGAMSEGCSCPAGKIFAVGTGCTSTSGFTPIDKNVEGTTYNCNGVEISINVNCEENENPIVGYLAGIINFLAAGVGLAVVAMIIVGGIQYVTSGGVPQKLEAARKRITNAVIALVVFIFMYAFLQWLIPGGIFNPAPIQCTPGTNQQNCAE